MIHVVKLDRPLYGLAAPGFSYALRNAARLIPGLTWDSSSRSWAGYPDAVAATAALLVKQGIPIDGLKTLPKPGEYGEPLMPIASKALRSYQEAGVRFLLAQGRTGALLADGMAVGKTIQAITAARALQNKTLILCPSHARGVWAYFDESEKNPGELQRWWPKSGLVCTPEGTKQFTPVAPSQGRFYPKEADTRYPSVMRAARVVVMHFDIVYAWVPTLIRWGFRTLIIDEAHLALQSARSRRSNAIRTLRQHATAVYALTGTPPTDRPRDLWNLVDILAPGRLGHFFSFGLRYAGGHQEEVTKDKVVWKFDGKSNLDELSERVKYFTLRRTKEDVGLELPPIIRQIIDIEIPARKRVAFTAGLMQSKKAMREALNLAANGKLNPCIELLTEHASNGHHVIAYTHRRSIANFVATAMSARGFASNVILGGVSPRKRRERIAAAAAAPAHVMACTIDAVSSAIDLSYADVAVFLEFTWDPKQIAQAEKRCPAKSGRKTRFSSNTPSLEARATSSLCMRSSTSSTRSKRCLARRATG